MLGLAERLSLVSGTAADRLQTETGQHLHTGSCSFLQLVGAYDHQPCLPEDETHMKQSPRRPSQHPIACQACVRPSWTIQLQANRPAHHRCINKPGRGQRNVPTPELPGKPREPSAKSRVVILSHYILEMVLLIDLWTFMSVFLSTDQKLMGNRTSSVLVTSTPFPSK